MTMSICVATIFDESPGPRIPTPMHEAESLRLYGTVTFAAGFIRPLIRQLPYDLSALELCTWFVLVPEAYRDDAERIAMDAAAGFVGSTITPDTLDALADRISGALRQMEQR
jgi:hypothetical protein